MSLGLNKERLQSLSEKIAERLPEVEVKNRMFLQNWSVMLRTAGKILPQIKAFKGTLEHYISETSVHDFVCEVLSRELHENQKYDSECPSLLLTQIDGYADPKATAERIVRDFESLPWDYSLLVEVANDFGEVFANTVKDFPLSDSAKLATPNKEFADAFFTKSGIDARDQDLAYLGYWASNPRLGFGYIGSLLGGPFVPPKSDKKYSYLQLKVRGFIGLYGETEPLREAISELKTFCGLGLALRLLRIKYNCRPMPTRARFIIHRHIADRWVIEGVHELEAALSDTFHDLVADDLDGQLKAENDKNSWMQRQLESIACVFRNRAQAEKIILASQWLFDSYCGTNELLSFIQATVVMEILLGDKAASDEVGLGKLLSNRCAYLIGDGQKEREDVLKQFKEIYDVRSRIVHSGKSRLTGPEHEMFLMLQWMCRRVIQEEVRLLQKDVNATRRELIGCSLMRPAPSQPKP